jgi:hypothetical protein
MPAAKNPTCKTMKKKGKGGQVKVKTEAVESFFKVFNPPKIPDEPPSDMEAYEGLKEVRDRSWFYLFAAHSQFSIAFCHNYLLYDILDRTLGIKTMIWPMPEYSERNVLLRCNPGYPSRSTILLFMTAFCNSVCRRGLSSRFHVGLLRYGAHSFSETS